MAKILLVEDDINLREIYAARLSAENYEVVTASDGEQALAVAVKAKPDVILLDVMMPKISGFDVLDILRSTAETKSCKVIILTALAQKIDKERGQKLGVDQYLIKSQITLEDVVRAIKDLVAPGPTPSSPGPANAGPTSVRSIKIEDRDQMVKPPSSDTTTDSPKKST